MSRSKKRNVNLIPTNTASESEDHGFINADGSVDGERLLQIIGKTPGAFSLLVIYRMVQSGHISPEYDWITDEIVDGFTQVVIAAAGGDEKAAEQIKAIEKLVKPEKFELPRTRISELVARYETSPHLARGWELRRLMSSLMEVVEPAKPDIPFTTNQPVKIKEDVSTTSLQQLAKEHWKRNTTLQSLAIRIYLGHLRKAGIAGADQTITDETLKRDLVLVRKWEETHTAQEKYNRGHYSGYMLSDGPITWCEFSSGWKTRRRTRSEQVAKRLTK
ncbi:MAG TPA: hypothetical protein VGO68_03775 [Pyrinomonadaceae bacterium]|jgi:hypothetical protein|nr:hypothetical protein [Pyrinomonadaceae bacterium]